MIVPQILIVMFSINVSCMVVYELYRSEILPFSGRFAFATTALTLVNSLLPLVLAVPKASIAKKDTCRRSRLLPWAQYCAWLVIDWFLVAAGHYLPDASSVVTLYSSCRFLSIVSESMGNLIQPPKHLDENACTDELV